MMVMVAASALLIAFISWADLRSRHFREFAQLRLLKSRLPDQARAEFHQDMRARYSRAARRPWLSVEAEPPEPPGRH
jgi:hypothetical protein